MSIQILFPFLNGVICLLIVELSEFFIYSEYQTLISYMICKYSSPFCGLSVHALERACTRPPRPLHLSVNWGLGWLQPSCYWPDNKLEEFQRHELGATGLRQSLGKLFLLSLDSQVHEPIHLLFNWVVQLPAAESLNDTGTKPRLREKKSWPFPSPQVKQ